MQESPIRPSLPRVLSLSPVLAVAALVAGCGTGAKVTSEKTVAAWSTDKFVPATDSRTAAMNAARILAMPERAVDRTMQVGAISAVVHEKPSVTSRALGLLAVGDAVKVVAEGDFMRQPASGNVLDYVGAKGGDITPTWVKVKAGSVTGWMPARALVSPIDFSTSTESFIAASGEAGAKGFSRKVKLEATAVKGMAGTPKLQGSNYAAATAMMERMKAPLKYDVGPAPSPGAGRLAGLPAVGQDLATLDPAAAAAAAAAQAKANEPGDFAKAADAGMDLLGKVGIKQAEDPNVKLGVEVAKWVEYFQKPVPVTAAEERLVGRECLAKLLAGAKVLPDSSPVSAYVRWVGAKVAANSSSPYSSMGMDFIVLQDDAVNAVAVAGGPVAITTGMLAFLENEDELAAILAHETAHVEERHSLDIAIDKGLPKLPRLISAIEMSGNGALEKVILAQAKEAKLPDGLAKQLTPMVSKELAKVAADILQDITVSIVNEAWKDGDQGLETGADLRGMSLASAAGYDPAALDAVLVRLKAKIGDYGGANYSPERAKLDLDALPLLPAPDGKPAAAPAAKDGSAAVREVVPSKEAVARWSKLDAELKRK